MNDRNDIMTTCQTHGTAHSQIFCENKPSEVFTATLKQMMTLQPTFYLFPKLKEMSAS
jgi:hypothetical protein